MSLTDAQHRAIKSRGNVLVSAGAGTGKTRTVVERCLACLLDEKLPASLEQILMVTFTEAAAAEMRQRIRECLEQESKRRPEALRLHEQLALFDTAYIGTLHSFCLRLIRPHFYELELDPQLSVLAEEEAQLLAEETLTTVLEGHFAGRTPGAEAVQHLIQTYGAGADQRIRGLVLRLHHYTQTLPDPAGWFEEQLKIFVTSEPVQWRQWLLATLSEWRKDSLSLLEARAGNQIARQCAAGLKKVHEPLSREAMAVALEKIVAVCEACPRGAKAQLLTGLNEWLTDARFLLSVTASSGDADPLKEDWEWVRGHMTTLLRLTREFSQRFTENKRELGMLDFHDLEQYALRLLWDTHANAPTPIARQWRKQLRYIFVDEYQDINAAQDRIIEALSGENALANRFLVGDVKQSIYRFRLANPRIFRGYLNLWQASGTVIPLTDNFRSREKLLEFINSFFRMTMKQHLGDVDYDGTAELRFADGSKRKALSAEASKAPRVELHLRIKKAGADAEWDEQIDEALAEALEMQETDKEARLVALRVRKLVQEQHSVWDEKENRFRPVQWNDIAILLRAPSRKAESYAKEFSRLKIPLVVNRSGFYESIEISDLVSLLQILDNPLQDVPMLAVLHSPLAGLTINELGTIRLAAKGPFWTAVVLWANSSAKKEASRTKNAGTTDSLHETLNKVQVFLERFGRWRGLARQTSLSRCLETVLAETHYETWLLSQPRGEQRHANVRRLLHLAQRFDNFQRQGLFRFLCFIAAQKRAGSEPEVKPVAAENAVRLMSIHQSKGLEFPVVVVADLGKPFNLADVRAGIILDEQYGLSPQIKPPHSGKRYPSLSNWLARRRQHRELLGEELRLLYVAMTRARDTLILNASISQKRMQNLWNGESGLVDLSKGRSLADWVGFWFAQHCSGGPAAGNGNLEMPMPLSGENDLLKWEIHDETGLIEPGHNIEEPVLPIVELPENRWLQLQERLSWQYPFLEATRTPAKASVTSLRRQADLEGDDEAFHLPYSRQFGPGRPGKENLKGKVKVSAADIGSAHHKFLQLVDLEGAGSLESLRNEAQRMLQEKIITTEQIAVLNFDALNDFFSSEPGLKIRSHANCVQRELQFTATFPAQNLAEITRETLPFALQSEFIIVQGVADLVVVMKRELWLLDFKTDAVKPIEVEAKVQLYNPQMKLYARALSQIYQRPVTECWLYFLACGRAVSISLE